MWTWYSTGIKSKLFKIVSSTIEILPYRKYKTWNHDQFDKNVVFKPRQIITRIFQMGLYLQFLGSLSSGLLLYYTSDYYWLTFFPIGIETILALGSLIFLVSSTINWKTNGKIRMARINFVSNFTLNPFYRLSNTQETGVFLYWIIPMRKKSKNKTKKREFQGYFALFVSHIIC